MAVEIIKEGFEATAIVEQKLVIDTIEKSRDRIRVTANMIVAFSGVLISFSSALVLFVTKDDPAQRASIILFVCAVVAFLSAATMGIASTYLRSESSISNHANFIFDLTRLYRAELRLLRGATASMIFGLVFIVTALATFLHAKWS
jgi:hypothetical protein